MLYKPSALHAHLKKHGIAPKKSFSQNFLIDKNIIQRVLNQADVQEGEHVLEIGPGPGALTEALVARGARVIAVEKDPDFARANEAVAVIEGDFLTLPITSILPKDTTVKIVANLPYNITTPLLERLFSLHRHITTMTIMVQKEVADRCVATPNTKEYGALSLCIQMYASCLGRFDVKPNSFFPRPAVHSSVITLQMHPERSITEHPTQLHALIKAAFGQRRKMLRSSLRRCFSSDLLEHVFADHPQLASKRPEQLALPAFISLAQSLERASEKIDRNE